ncbi:uncharacterized protein LOC135677479 [Musa acuminata AAA Group]|uniref:uncharacterized protein LOC135677479 n=1 Tax=Musa acuminata AAA Group TaxID=214697 RepID=UPI0031D9FFC4
MVVIASEEEDRGLIVNSIMESLSTREPASRTIDTVAGSKMVYLLPTSSPVLSLSLSTLSLPPSASLSLRPSHWIDHGGAAPTNLVKGRDLVRVGIDSGRALVLDSKLLGKLLKVSHFGSTCHSAKMNRTVIVCRNYLHYVNKYQSSHIPKLQC